MSHIAPVPLDDIADPELRALIAEGEALGVPDALFPRVLAHVPSYAKVLMRALLMSHAGGNVDHRLKELIRIQLARFAGDGYFAALRSAVARRAGLTEAEVEAACGHYEDAPYFTAAEKCALRYADRMYRYPDSINAKFYAELKRHFTEPQIMELGAFIAFHYGMQAFMRTLRASPLAKG
ncbi:MAG: carboxymuconolactone decarboxylase family protein [Proteobacteria bacterium]|nr:carboxymuconolactone decarboxylase family protein [Pseudomonadota bacterium]